MQQYRMLRNNKESGPYSWQDLIDMPLKAYDLIWVEGKSASWRYPSEIEELKAHAPAVQEDFYAQFHTPAKVAKTAAAGGNTAAGKTSRKSDEKRFVAVILPPSGKESAAVIGIKAKPATIKEAAPALEKKPNMPEIVADVVINTPVPLLTAEPVVETIANPQQLPKKTIKRETIIPTEKILAEDSALSLPEPVPYKPNNSRYWIAAALLALLAGGIYLGTRQTTDKISGPSATETSNRQGSKISNAVPASNEVPADADDDIPRLQPNTKLDFASLKRHITVSTDHYDAGFFGGISNLQLTITNNSARQLQKLVIAIDYLNSDKSIHHTENIMVEQVAPNGKTTVSVPDSRNGVAFQTRVIGINGLSNP